MKSIFLSFIFLILIYTEQSIAQTFFGTVVCSDESMNNHLQNTFDNIMIDNGLRLLKTSSKSPDYFYSLDVIIYFDEDCKKYFYYYYLIIFNNLSQNNFNFTNYYVDIPGDKFGKSMKIDLNENVKNFKIYDKSN